MKMHVPEPDFLHRFAPQVLTFLQYMSCRVGRSYNTKLANIDVSDVVLGHNEHKSSLKLVISMAHSKII
jgi:hypothetical protein